MIGVIIVRMGMVEKADEFIEPLLRRQAFGILLSQTPFADATRMIAGLFQELGDGEIVRAQILIAPIAAHERMSTMKPGHERTTRRRANGAAGVGARETNPLPCQFIEVGRFYLLLPITTEVSVTQVIGKNKNNIRLLRKIR